MKREIKEFLGKIEQRRKPRLSYLTKKNLYFKTKKVIVWRKR